MGIQGLIPFLEKASRKINVSQFAGSCVAVDAYCWLHRGAYTCGEKLARGEQCDAYVFYCLKFINMLLSHNIKPILVFDGRHLPSKAATEKKRRDSRELNRKHAAELLRAGRTDEARNYLRRSIDVSHEMALALIRECRRINVDCIVAPHEADAQLAFLNLKGIAEVIITEDSDLVLFGCKKILFKMDMMGNGTLVEQERLHLAMGVRVENFSFDVFRYMCILSGCDYLPSLPGIGLGKALKFFKRTADPDISRALTRIPAHLNMPNLKVTPEYREEFLRADAAFRHQLVFDPLSRIMVPLTDHPELDCFIGEKLSPEDSFQLALGNLDPFSMKRVDDFNPDSPQKFSARKAPHQSIWSKNYVAKLPSRQPIHHSPETSQKVAFVDVKLLQTKSVTVVPGNEQQFSETDLTILYRGPDLEPPLKKIHLAIPDFRSENENCAGASSGNEDKTTSPSSGNEGEATSPVLVKKTNRNPFLKESSSSPIIKKDFKFSALKKFSSVSVKTPQEVVRSRYFASVEIKHETDAIESSGDCEDSSTLTDISNVMNNADTSASFMDISNVSKNADATSHDASSCSDPAFDASVEFSSIVKQDVNEFSTRSIQSVGKTCSAFKWSNIAASCKENYTVEEDSYVSATPKKSKTCRRQGLSRNTPSVAQKEKSAQQSLLSMFGFQKKNKLQHSC